MTRVTCRLTAKNQDYLPNPTLGNRVWATYLEIMRIISGYRVLGVYVCRVTSRAVRGKLYFV